MKEYRRVRHAAHTAVLTVRGCSDLLGDAAADGPGGLNAGGARLGQAAGDARPVTGGKEAGDGGLQLAGQLQTGGVELHLRPVEQGVVIGGARGDLCLLYTSRCV